jgi:hypothetical protein
MDVESGDNWKQVADVTAWGAGTAKEAAFDNWPIDVFHQEVRFDPVKARRVRLRITRASSAPIIHEFQLYER